MNLIKNKNLFTGKISKPKLVLFLIFITTLINPIIGLMALLIFIFSLRPEIGLYALAFLLPVINWYLPIDLLNINAPGFNWEFAMPIVDFVGATSVSYTHLTLPTILLV